MTGIKMLKRLQATLYKDGSAVLAVKGELIKPSYHNRIKMYVCNILFHDIHQMLKLTVEGIMLSWDCTSLILRSISISASEHFTSTSDAARVLLCVVPFIEAATYSIMA